MYWHFKYFYFQIPFPEEALQNCLAFVCLFSVKSCWHGEG